MRTELIRIDTPKHPLDGPSKGAAKYFMAIKCPVLFIRGDQGCVENYLTARFAESYSGPCELAIVPDVTTSTSGWR